MRAFSEIAPYYDALMSDINYGGWFSYIQKLLKVHRFQPSRVLDVACGTGTMALFFDRHKYEVEGLDSSLPMLEVARAKAKEAGSSILFHHADMRNFNLEAPVDLAVSVFDSFNYLLHERDLESCFKSCYRCLTPGGALIFDMNTPFGLGMYATPQVEVKEGDDSVSIWHMAFQASNRMARLDLTLFVKEGEFYRRIDEVHQERGYMIGRVEDHLHEASFSEVHTYSHMTFRPAYTSTKRIMVVARK
jgi:ubiquinone/menaquinone biosynthesis C-methylase UbiE